MNPSIGFARRLALAVMLACLAVPALPQASGGYAVEIIVFRNGSDAGALAENAGQIIFSDDDVATTATTSRKLGGSATRLNNGGLRVLGHAAWRQGPSAWKSRRGVSAAKLGAPGISGKVIFERGEYLHLGVDLLVEDGGKRYRINEVRPVKTDEIQYFDHPAIGVLAIVSRED